MSLAVINFSEVWPIIATVVGIASGVCSAAIWFSMQSLKDGMNSTARKQDEDKKAIDKEVATIKDRMAACKQDCDRTMVSKEDWVREVGYSRRLAEQQIKEMAEIKALQQQLPDTLARILAATMKRGD